MRLNGSLSTIPFVLNVYSVGSPVGTAKKLMTECFDRYLREPDAISVSIAFATSFASTW